MRTISIKNDICDDKYFSLFPIKMEVDKIFSLALELNMDKQVIEEWRQLTVLVNNCIDGLRHKSHQQAIKELKLLMGGSKGLNDDNARIVRRILRDSQRTQPILDKWGPPQPMIAGNPYMPPVQNFANPNVFGSPKNTQSAYNGQCFNCNQFGHMARDCNLSHRAQPQRGRRGGRFVGFRGRGGRRGRA